MAAAPLGAQFQIKRYPELPQPKVEEEKEPEEAPIPTYAGADIRLPVNCQIEKLEYAGLLCSSERPCNLSLDMTALAASGDFVVLAGEIYSTEATFESVVISSSDGGETWKEAAERVAAAGIEAIEIVEEVHAWAAGQQGDTATVEKPFTLYTDDAGESWSLRKLGTLDEPVRGVVVDLRLDSPKHGYMVLENLAATGDRFQLRETFNGGRSWSVRQITAERPKIPGGRFLRPPEKLWRIREESDRWLIERRNEAEPDGWTAAAGFLLELDPCPAPSSAGIGGSDRD
ncbi:MAG: glycoside hydrolase [Pirellulales bacterium]|nr:glycoside hydrolase [Pirellulales bacterium]